MSTPTTARGALLRRAGTLLVAAALVGAPATSAFADPTASHHQPTPVTASPTPGDHPADRARHDVEQRHAAGTEPTLRHAHRARRPADEPVHRTRRTSPRRTPASRPDASPARRPA